MESIADDYECSKSSVYRSITCGSKIYCLPMVVFSCPAKKRHTRRGVRISNSCLLMILADSGYQGIQEYYGWSLIPMKKSKTHSLLAEEKVYNRELSRRRISIENINAEIKVFKIMTYPYRNRRRRHLLRTKLVWAILNAEKA